MSSSTEESLAKYTIKASVFTDLFTISKYLLQMYRVLHPEDSSVTEADLTDVPAKRFPRQFGFVRKQIS